MVVKLRITVLCSSSKVDKVPPIKLTVTGVDSSLVTEINACVGWPLTSFTPKISASGKDACADTAKFGASASSPVFSAVASCYNSKEIKC